MRFHRPNPTGATVTFVLPVERVAAMFCSSEFAFAPWLLDLRIRAILTNPVGPINARWDDQAAFDQLVDAVLTHRLQMRRAGRP